MSSGDPALDDDRDLRIATYSMLWLREHLAACGFIPEAPHRSNRSSPAMIDGRSKSPGGSHE